MSYLEKVCQINQNGSIKELKEKKKKHWSAKLGHHQIEADH
jgi:murein L,D-transpeptidase YafK